MLRILGGVLALALAAGLYLLLSDSDRGTREPALAPVVAAPPQAQPEAAPEVAALTAVDELPAERSAVVPADVAVAAEGAIAAADHAEAEDAPGAYVLRGSVRVTLPDGTVADRPTGVLTVYLWVGGRGTSRDLDVDGGSFEVSIEGAPPDRVVVRRGIFGDLIAAPAEEVGFDPLQPLDVRLIAWRPVVLDVRDAETGEPTGSVEIASREQNRRHPGLRPNLVVTGAPSPVWLTADQVDRLGRSRGRQQLFVRAEGYAWAMIEVDLTGADRVVELVPGGSLAVDVVGLPGDEGLNLHLEKREAGLVRCDDTIRSDGRYVFEGLEEGAVRVAVQRGRWFDDPRVFGEAEGEVAAGETTEVAIDVRFETAVEALTFEVSVELDLPEAWGDEPLTLSAEVAESPSGERGNAEARGVSPDRSVEGRLRYVFELGEMVEGDWALTLDRTGWRGGITVDRSGVYPIELPGPAEVLLTVLDGDGVPLGPDENVSWYAVYTGPSNGWGHEDCESLDEPGTFGLVAPAGEIVVSVFAAGRGHASETFEVVPGPQSIEYRLPERQAIRVRMLDGEDVVTPTDWSWRFTVDRIDGLEPTRGQSSSSTGGVRTIFVDPPGRFRVTFPPLNGYHGVEPIEVDVPAGEIVALDVQVEPKE